MSGLVRGGVDPARPAFISWLGVSMYLTHAAVMVVFRTVATFCAGTELVFTFAQPRGPGPSLADRAAAAGEPWLSYFDPDELRDVLTGAGFSAVDFLGVAEAARYLAGRTDSLAAPRRVSIASAQV